jgi:hypothetical protein
MATATIARQRNRAAKPLSKSERRDLEHEAEHLCRHVLARCDRHHPLWPRFNAFAANLNVDDYTPDDATLIDLVKSFMEIDGRERMRILGGWALPTVDRAVMNFERAEFQSDAASTPIQHAIVLTGDEDSIDAIHCLQLLGAETNPVRAVIVEGTDPALASATLRSMADALDANFYALAAFPNHLLRFRPAAKIRLAPSDAQAAREPVESERPRIAAA